MWIVKAFELETLLKWIKTSDYQQTSCYCTLLRKRREIFLLGLINLTEKQTGNLEERLQWLKKYIKKQKASNWVTNQWLCVSLHHSLFTISKANFSQKKEKKWTQMRKWHLRIQCGRTLSWLLLDLCGACAFIQEMIHDLKWIQSNLLLKLDCLIMRLTFYRRFCLDSCVFWLSLLFSWMDFTPSGTSCSLDLFCFYAQLFLFLYE